MEKERKNRGFTLVELIAVLVILAILAAILVPALLGYIDRAKNEQYVLYARNAMTATQSVLAEMYGRGEPAYNIRGSNPYDKSCTKEYYNEVLDLNDAYFRHRVLYGDKF